MKLGDISVNDGSVLGYSTDLDRKVSNEVDISEVESRLGYVFNNKNLLKEALSHPSINSGVNVVHYNELLNNDLINNFNKEDNFSSLKKYISKKINIKSVKTLLNYERLEFLGDSIVNLVITEFLYKNYQSHNEGNMSQMKGWLVSEEVLKECALYFGFDKFMRIGPSEEKTGGRSKSRLLANVFESVVAAISLDAGLDEAKRFTLNALNHCLEKESEDNKDSIEINPKGKLQEILQKTLNLTPEYKIYDNKGKDHNKTFFAEVSLNKVTLGKGQGSSKKRAEIDAAEKALGNKIWEII